MNDINHDRPNKKVNHLESQKDYKELSTLINYKGNYLKDTQAKIAEISNYLKKFKILEDPQYYNTNKEYVQLIKSTKIKLENLIFQTLIYADSSLRIENFKINKYDLNLLNN